MPLPAPDGWAMARDNALQVAKESMIRLPDAHGEEIVRSLCIDSQVVFRISLLFIQTAPSHSFQKSLTLMTFQSSTVFTAGEDGRIRAWRAPDTAEPSHAGTAKPATDGKKKKKKSKEEKRDRWQPY